MALLELLLGKQNPAAQWAGQNSNFLGALGAGLASGPDLATGIGQGLKMAPQAKMLDMQVAEQQAEKAKQEQQQNYTRSLLEKEAPDLAQLLDTGIPMGEVWGEYLRRKQPGGVKTNPYMNAGQGQFFNWQTGEWVSNPDASSIGNQPSSVQEWEYYNALPNDKKGEYLRMKRASPYLDIGTGFVQPDPLNPGTTAGPAIVKDNFTPAYDAAAGKGLAGVDVETEATAASLASKMPGLKTVVSELSQLAKTATYTQSGQLIDNVMRETGREPSGAAIARTKYIAMVDNQVLPLLRDTFGAAFTVKEGDTLRATLGDPNKSPAEKQVILEAFIEQKVRDLEALQSRLPGAPANQAGAAPVNNDPLNIRGGQ